MGFRSPMNGLPPSSITADMLEDGAVTGAKLSADAIDGRVITGALIRTAETGQRRLELDSFAANALTGYSGDPDELEPSVLEMFNKGLRLRANTLDGGPGEGATARLEMDYESTDGGATWDGYAALRGGGRVTLDPYFDFFAAPGQVRAVYTIQPEAHYLRGDVNIGPRGGESTPGALVLNDSRPVQGFDCGRLSISNATNNVGEYTFNHNVGTTPAAVTVTSRHTGVVRHYSVLNPTTTTITVRVRDGDGLVLPAGSLVSFEWAAFA